MIVEPTKQKLLGLPGAIQHGPDPQRPSRPLRILRADTEHREELQKGPKDHINIRISPSGVAEPSEHYPESQVARRNRPLRPKLA